LQSYFRKCREPSKPPRERTEISDESDKEYLGYAAVDHNAQYFRLFGRILIGAQVLVSAGAINPSVRDWACRAFLPGSYATAQVQPQSNADIGDALDRPATSSRRCGGWHGGYRGTLPRWIA
jgi:hypothetical protein